MVRRKVGVYVKNQGVALIRDVATNREFTVIAFTQSVDNLFNSFIFL